VVVLGQFGRDSNATLRAENALRLAPGPWTIPTSITTKTSP